jgi:hypothetical protein
VVGDAAPGWLDELSLEPGPPWHPMGTRSLGGEMWLINDDERDVQLALKRQLLANAHDVVVACEPGADDSAVEAAEMVAGAATLEDAAMAVQEDLCVLCHRDGHWRLDAAVVCFPSMWRLSDKIGLPLAAVHAPVPAYADELADRVDRFLDRLRVDRPVWRRNWFVHHSPELHQPAPPPAPEELDVPKGLWLRSERQTLRRLERTGAILFTIRTQQAPLAAVATRPDVAAAMADAIEAWSEDLVAYRAAEAWRDRVVRWLREAAA